MVQIHPLSALILLWKKVAWFKETPVFYFLNQFFFTLRNWYVPCTHSKCMFDPLIDCFFILLSEFFFLAKDRHVQSSGNLQQYIAAIVHSWIFLRFFLLLLLSLLESRKVKIKNKMDKSTQACGSSIVSPPGAWQLSAHLSRTIRAGINELAKKCFVRFSSCAAWNYRARNCEPLYGWVTL